MSVISSHNYNLPGEIQSHVHAHAHIILPLDQYFYIRFQNQEHCLQPNQIGFVPPGVLHYFGCPGKALTLNIPAEMIKSSDLVFLSENSVREIDEKLMPLISLIKQETSGSSQNKDSLRYLFYYLYDKLVEQGRIPSLQYIEENYAADITIREMAELENYNISYYTEWFKKNVGCLPSEYLRMVRIDKAKEILATTRYRIIDVAMQVGYYNSSSFTRAFREVEGITPKQYRKKAQEAKLNSGGEAIPQMEIREEI
ncbi:MAG: AraC family transcriptional regulator [Clostridiales bacterium]|nr:AraC family transcriptional regulator [Clostridiales bacterium]